MSDILTGRDSELEKAAASPVPASLDLDASKYSAELEDFEMTEDQKRELLETLWSIMRSFVELGFSVDVCGALSECADEISIPPSGDVKWLTATATEMPPDGTEGMTSP